MSALIVPDFDRCRAWGRLQKLDLPTDAAVASHPEIVRLVQADVDEVNASLAPFERVRRFALLPAELTPETGELTPTLKVKRRIVAQKYATAIESLYEGHS